MDIKETYKELSKEIPLEGIQKSKGSETRKGYDTIGYGYQFLVNRFNEVLGIGKWNWSFVEIEREEGQFKSGQKYYEVSGIATITLFLEDKEISHSEYGGHRASALSDALKGASTNSFKKTASFFGVGKQAFEKSIDEDNQESKDKVVSVGGKKISIASIIAKMKKCEKVEELEDNIKKFNTSDRYNETQKRVILRAIQEKITELQANV